MLFYKATLTPPLVLRNPRGILETVSRPLVLTPWKRSGRGRRAFLSSAVTMSSDADYAAFLKRSQKDYSQPPEGAPKQDVPTVSATQAEVHPAVRALGERYYVSDADEPFEGVSFAWGKGVLPSEDEFRDLIGVQRGREIRPLQPKKWDAHGRYKDIIEAVTRAANGTAVRIYSVEGAGTRVEYFILGVNSDEGKLVGVKALSIES